MKINGIEVTRRDLEGLLKSVQYCIKSIDENEPEKAKWTLEVLESHLSRNLLADKNKEIKVGKEVA